MAIVLKHLVRTGVKLSLVQISVVVAAIQMSNILCKK